MVGVVYHITLGHAELVPPSFRRVELKLVAVTSCGYAIDDVCTCKCITCWIALF